MVGGGVREWVRAGQSASKISEMTCTFALRDLLIFGAVLLNIKYPLPLLN